MLLLMVDGEEAFCIPVIPAHDDGSAIVDTISYT
jgi:hypothetical protein